MRDEMHGMHKMKGAGMLVLGLLILANVYWGFLNWATFIGALLALGGLLKWLMLCCKKKKRR
jgi:uncharacterized membrane protein HdeD (DUF308 family)